MELKFLNKEPLQMQKSLAVDLKINNKEVSITIFETYNQNTETINVDFEYIEDYNLTDEESDEIHEWVNSYKYEDVKPDYKKAFNLLMNYWDSIADEEKEELNEKLKEIGV